MGTTRLPSIADKIGYPVTRFVTQSAVLNIVKQVCPSAYINGNNIVMPTAPSGHKEGDGYAIRITTTPSYVTTGE